MVNTFGVQGFGAKGLGFRMWKLASNPRYVGNSSKDDVGVILKEGPLIIANFPACMI